MKDKKLIIGVGIAVLLYFLFKSKEVAIVTEKVKETIKPKEDKQTYYKRKDGKVMVCAKGYIGGTKENPSLNYCKPNPNGRYS